MDNDQSETLSEDEKSAEETWNQLSQEAQHAAINIFLLSPEHTGADEDAIPFLQIGPDSIEELIENGWLQIRTRGDFAKEYIEAHQEEQNLLEKRNMNIPSSLISREDIEKMDIFQMEMRHINDERLKYNVPKNYRKFLDRFRKKSDI